MGFCQVYTWNEVPPVWTQFEQYRGLTAQHTTFLDYLQRELAAQEGTRPFAFKRGEFAFPATFARNMRHLKLTTRLGDKQWYDGLVGACLASSAHDIQHLERKLEVKDDSRARLTYEQLMEVDQKCPPIPHTFVQLEAFATRVQLLWAHLLGDTHPALTLYINPLVKHLNEDPEGYKDYPGWAQLKAGTVIYYLKKIEQTYLDFKLMEAQLDQPGNIPWPRFHPLVQSVPELLNTDPFKYSRDLPPLLQELPTAPHAHESPEPPHKRLRITPSPTPPAGLQPAPRPTPEHTNTNHNPKLREFLQVQGPEFRMAHILSALDKKISHLLTELGLTYKDCARFHVLGQCTDLRCTRDHTATSLPDAKVQNAIQLLQHGCDALAAPAPVTEES
jgi:hypothetical protein